MPVCGTSLKPLSPLSSVAGARTSAGRLVDRFSWRRRHPKRQPKARRHGTEVDDFHKPWQDSL
jgi:hypothetical protein